MAAGEAMTRRGLLKAIASALAAVLTIPLGGVRRATAGDGGTALPDRSPEAGELAAVGSLAESVSPALMQIMCAHCAAYAELGRISKRTDAIALGDDPAPVDLERRDEVSESERKLFMQLCRYPASNDAERQEKAVYLMAFCDGDEFECKHVEALLASMRATGTSDSQPVRLEVQSS